MAASLASASVLGCSSRPDDTAQAEGAIVTGTPLTVVTDPAAMTYLETHGYSFAERFAGRVNMRDPNGESLSAVSGRYRALTNLIREDVYEASATYANYGNPAWRLPIFPTAQYTARQRLGGGGYQGLNFHWLESSALRFELIAVVNRFDRRVLPTRSETCGELRLIYRAAYSAPRESSRLPITVVLVFPQPGDDCQEAARAWVHPNAPAPAGEALGQWLESHPLRGLGALMSVELDALTDLWSRFVRTRSGVGRHHRYTLRVMRPVGDALVPEPLDNTPDVAKIVGREIYDVEAASWSNPGASEPRRRALLDWIRDHKSEVEHGTAYLPPLQVEGEGQVDIRATRTDSFSAMGFTRISNRPYTQIFGDNIEAVREGAELESAAEAHSLLRKLDMMTCSGCHATRSILGIHLVGEERDYAKYVAYEDHPNDADYAADRDRPEGYVVDRSGTYQSSAPLLARVTANRMAVGISPHLRDERDRRAKDLRAFLDGRGGVDMPPPDRGAALRGVHGAPCALPGAEDLTDADRAALVCKEGLQCVDVDGTSVGQCTTLYGTSDAEFPERRSVGDPYQRHAYSAHSTMAMVHPFQENGPVAQIGSCFTGGATGRSEGFPFAGVCNPISSMRLIKEGAGECYTQDGAIALGESAYVSKVGTITKQPDRPGARRVVCSAAPTQGRVSSNWGYMSTAAMIWNSTAPGFQAGCDEDDPCRDEYVCMRQLPHPERAKRDPRQGVCVPGYVLAQLEIDSHLIPNTTSVCILPSPNRGVVSCE